MSINRSCARGARRLVRLVPAVTLAWLGGALHGGAIASAPEPRADSAALTFDRALRLAMRQAPALRAGDLAVAAAEDAAVPAGELPDPKIWFGVDGLPVEGDDRFSLGAEPMTMTGIGFEQAFPNRDKRWARAAAAAGRVDLAESELGVAQARVLEAAAVAWIEVHTVESQLALVEALFDENQLFAAAVRARLAGGVGAGSDLVAPRQEAVRLEELRDTLVAERIRSRAMLARWIGPAAERPLAGGVPAWPAESSAAPSGVHLHPDFRAFDARARILTAEVEEAEAARRPDWELELGWQRRDSRFGDMVMLRVAMDLPLRPSRRQNPEISARRARQAALEAEREAALREHFAEATADMAELQRLDAAVQRLVDVALPLAEQKIDLILADWRAGRVTLSDVVAARREQIETRLRQMELAGQRHAAAARLHFAYGIATAEGVQP